MTKSWVPDGWVGRRGSRPVARGRESPDRHRRAASTPISVCSWPYSGQLNCARQQALTGFGPGRVRRSADGPARFAGDGDHPVEQGGDSGVGFLVVGLLRGLQVFRAFGVMTGAGLPHGHEDSETLVPSLHSRGHGLLADRADKRPLGTGLMLGFNHLLTVNVMAAEGEQETGTRTHPPAFDGIPPVREHTRVPATRQARPARGHRARSAITAPGRAPCAWRPGCCSGRRRSRSPTSRSGSGSRWTRSGQRKPRAGGRRGEVTGCPGAEGGELGLEGLGAVRGEALFRSVDPREGSACPIEPMEAPAPCWR